MANNYHQQIGQEIRNPRENDQLELAQSEWNNNGSIRPAKSFITLRSLRGCRYVILF
jgi:hypothetical protein